MNQASYIFIMFSPLLVFFFLCLCLCLWSWCKEKGYMKMLLELIATNAFPEILKEKTGEDGKVVLYFDKEKLMLRSDEQLNLKVKRGLFLVAYLLVANILQLFGAFLFLKTSSYCDETKDCFLVGGPINHPINCEDIKKKNETTAVVCYEIVFSLPTAVGLCYGIFKTCTVALTTATTLMMNMNLSHDKIVCTSCPTMTEISLAKFIIVLSCVICTIPTIIFYRGPLHGLDWEEVSAEATLVLTCLVTSIYVGVMPLEELMFLKNNLKEGTADERAACGGATVSP